MDYNIYAGHCCEDVGPEDNVFFCVLQVSPDTPQGSCQSKELRSPDKTEEEKQIRSQVELPHGIAERPPTKNSVCLKKR